MCVKLPYVRNYYMCEIQRGFEKTVNCYSSVGMVVFLTQKGDCDIVFVAYREVHFIFKTAMFKLIHHSTLFPTFGICSDKSILSFVSLTPAKSPKKHKLWFNLATI